MTRFSMHLILGACCWFVIIGLVLAITAPNGFPGVLVMVVSIISSVFVLSWLSEHYDEED